MKLSPMIRLSVPTAVATAVATVFNASVASAATFGTSNLFGFNNPNTNVTGSGKTTIASLANTVIDYFLYIAGIVAVIMLVWYGFQYITAGGDGERVKKARAGIINAVIGIIIIVAAFFIIRVAIGLGNGVGNSSTGGGSGVSGQN